MGDDSGNVVEGLLKKIARGEPPFVRAQCGELGPRGFQVAVAVMKEFDVPAGSSNEATAQAFAKRLHDMWGVGLAECNNGVVLLLSVLNRQLYISAGAGTVSQLTYDALGDVIDGAKPLLRAQQYGAAVEQAVLDVGLLLAGQRPVRPRGPGAGEASDGGGGGGSVFMVFLMIAGGMFGWAWWQGRAQRMRYQVCRSQLDRIRREQQLARAGRTYEFTTCPICLEDLQQPPPPNAATSINMGTAAPALGFVAPTTSCQQQSCHEAQPSLLEDIAGGAASRPACKGAPRAPIILPCGHAFCEPCIQTWLRDKVTCPICRRPVDASNDASAPLDPNAPCAAGLLRPGFTAPSTTQGDGAWGASSSSVSSAFPVAGGMLSGGGGFATPGMMVVGSPTPMVNMMGMGPTMMAGGPMGVVGHVPMVVGAPGGMMGVAAASPYGGLGGGSSSLAITMGNDPMAGRHGPFSGMHGPYGSPFGGAPMGIMHSGSAWGVGHPNAVYATLLAQQQQMRMMRYGGMFGHDLLLAEMAYRVHSLHRHYPDVLTHDMAEQMARDVSRGVDLNTAALRTVQLSDPTARSHLRNSGSIGTHVSMGGGSSAGGGGRGGSW